MPKERVEMLSPESSLAIAEELGLHEAVAKLNIFRTMFRRPKTAKAISDLLHSLLLGAALDHRSREFVIMRIGWVTGSDYEWTTTLSGVTDAIRLRWRGIDRAARLASRRLLR